MGLHSRIGQAAATVRGRARKVGNLYVNRSMIGAVVGVQPFGGEGLSGTGPKAGGPHYLPRFAVERTCTDRHHLGRRQRQSSESRCGRLWEGGGSAKPSGGWGRMT